MKKIFPLLIAILFVFCGCTDGGVSEDADTEKSVTIVVDNDGETVAFRITTKSGNLYGAMKDLAQAEEAFGFEVGTGSKRGMITGINGVVPDNVTKYWSLFVSDKSKGADVKLYEYDGVTCYYSNYGVNELKLTDGAIYVWYLCDMRS